MIRRGARASAMLVVGAALFAPQSAAAASRPKVKVAPVFPGVAFHKPAQLRFTGTTLAKHAKVKRIVIAWGDGKRTTVRTLSAKPTHRYRGAGIFKIKVAVTDSHKRTGTAKTRVLVNLPPGLTKRNTTQTPAVRQILEIRTTGPTTKEITLAAGFATKVGRVLEASASPALPEGLLQIVTATRPGPNGTTIAETRQGTMEQAYSYYAVSAHSSLSSPNAFVLPGPVADDYKPAATAARLAVAGPRAHAASVGFGALLKTAFDCQWGGYAGYPFKIDFGVEPKVQDLRFDSQVSPLGKSFRYWGPFSLRFYAGVAATGGCQLTKKAQIVVPIPETPLLAIVRPIAGFTLTGSADADVTKSFYLDAGLEGTTDDPPTKQFHVDLRPVSQAIDVRGDLDAKITGGLEAAIGVGTIGSFADGGLQLTGNFDARGYVKEQFENGQHQFQACANVKFYPAAKLFAEINLPAPIQFVVDKAVGVIDGVKDWILRKMRRKEQGPQGLPKDPPKTRIETPEIAPVKLQIFPLSGHPECFAPFTSSGGSPAPSPTPTPTPTPAPTPPAGGKPLAWGSNLAGQAGQDPSASTVPAPTAMSGNLTNVVQVAASNHDTYALTSDGKVYAWGDDTYGQLGDGGGSPASSTPVQVPVPSGTTAKQISAGSGGADGAYALLSDGTVMYWGENLTAEAGNGQDNQTATPPVLVSGLTNVTAIQAGGGSGYALLADGTVRSWGSDGSWQLGHGPDSTSDETRPVTVLTGPGQLLTGVASLGAGIDDAFAVTTDGSVYSWGANSHGELGLGTTSSAEAYAAKVPSLSGIARVVSAAQTTFALGTDGRVWSWGIDDYDELGDGSSADHRSTPEAIPTLAGITQIAAGAYTGYALRKDGIVLGWGRNDLNQVGDGSMTQRPQPVTASGATAKTIGGGGANGVAVQ